MKFPGGPREPKPEQTAEFRAVLEQIKRARAIAPPLAECEARDTRENELLASFLRGEISLSAYHAQDERGDHLLPGEVEIPSLKLLYECLLFLIKDVAEARELTEHESEHLSEAARLGFPDSKILLRFFKKDGWISLRPAISLILPKSGDEEAIRQHVRAIIGAPEELSDLDEEQLK